MQAADKQGLAKTLLITAGFDLLSTEALRYREQLQADGVAVEHLHFAELGHGFIGMLGLLDAVDTSLTAIAQFVDAPTAALNAQQQTP